MPSFITFTDIMDDLKSLGRDYPLEKKNIKNSMSLSGWCTPKVVTISESKDLKKLSLDVLLGSLLTNEMDKGKEEIKI